MMQQICLPGVSVTSLTGNHVISFMVNWFRFGDYAARWKKEKRRFV